MKSQVTLVVSSLGVFTSLASAQEEILLSDDFEEGLGAWTVNNNDNGLWHIAEDGGVGRRRGWVRITRTSSV